MVETMAGIWLFLLTAGAGFLLGKHGKKTGRREKQQEKRETKQYTDFGWRELLNFLQYDGSGKPLTEGHTEREETSETQYNTRTDTGRVHARRSL